MMWENNGSADQIITQNGLSQVSDNVLLEELITLTLKDFPKQVQDYKAGKTKILGFLVGHVMGETKGKANPAMVKDLLEKALA